MNKRDIIIESVKNRIRKIDPDVHIILFGSRARNEAKEDSDWDFLILTSLQVNRQLKNRINDELFETELETDEVLTGVVQNINSWNNYSLTPFYKNIVKDGVEI